MLRLKICDSHLTCKVANKCLNVRERVEVVEWNKMVSSLPLLSCELWVSVKENPDRKKKKKEDVSMKRIYCFMIYYKIFEEQLPLISSWYIVHLGSWIPPISVMLSGILPCAALVNLETLQVISDIWESLGTITGC